jgi:hypothetical protein
MKTGRDRTRHSKAVLADLIRRDRELQRQCRLAVQRTKLPLLAAYFFWALLFFASWIFGPR